MYEDLIKALRRNMVETGSLICLGCGHEHNCGTKGCAILREAAAALEQMQAKLAALQTRFDEVNDFEKSQRAVLLVKLAEKDKQLAAANDEIESREEASFSEHAETHYWRDMAKQLKTHLAAVTAERDAAFADVPRECATCANAKANNATRTLCQWFDDCNLVDGDHWEWRGPQEAGEGTK